MKVAMVSPYPEVGKAVSGGVERVTDTLAAELSRRLDLVLIVPGGEVDATSTRNGVRIVHLKRAPGPGALRYWTVDAWRLARAVEAEKPDLVHLQGVAGVGRFVSTPRIHTVHGIVHRDLVISERGKHWGPIVRHGMARVMQAVEARSRRKIGNIIVINPYVLTALPDVSGLRQYPIPNPIDARFCAPLPCQTEPRKRRIVSVARIGPLKNTLGTIRAAARIMAQEPDVELVLCGKPVDRGYHSGCFDEIRSLGIGERVQVLGNLSTPELICELDRASCLLMASRQENAPLAIAEAHARGVAVVARKAFGIRYMITPSQNGFFLPTDDLDAQARVLRAALDYPWDRARIAADARQTYSPQRVAEMTLAAYRDVLARECAPYRRG